MLSANAVHGPLKTWLACHFLWEAFFNTSPVEDSSERNQRDTSSKPSSATNELCNLESGS